MTAGDRTNANGRTALSSIWESRQRTGSQGLDRGRDGQTIRAVEKTGSWKTCAQYFYACGFGRERPGQGKVGLLLEVLPAESNLIFQPHFCRNKAADP